MAQKETRIINHWTLLAFAQEKGADVAVGTCTAADGSSFQEISFTNQKGHRTYVDFGESLQPGMSFQEIVANANKLQVVELETIPEVLERRRQKGAQLQTYKLCKIGENTWQGGNLLVALGV
jgi:hypothetical protein